MAFLQYRRKPSQRKPVRAHLLTNADTITSIDGYRFIAQLPNGNTVEFVSSHNAVTGDYLVALDQDTDFENAVLVSGDQFEDNYELVDE